MQMPAKSIKKPTTSSTPVKSPYIPNRKNTPTLTESPLEIKSPDVDDTLQVNDTPAAIETPVSTDKPATSSDVSTVEPATTDPRPEDKDDEDDDDLEIDDAGEQAHEPDAPPSNTDVLTSQRDQNEAMNKQIENLTKLIASNAKQHAEQVAALQDQFNERERNPRRGRSFVMRPWMAEATIQALPTVSTAPVLVLNGPMDGDCVRWKKKRDELIAKWTELCMYDPTKTWGNCATNNDKVQMVCHACFIVCHCTGMSNVCVCVCVCVCPVHRRKPRSGVDAH